jgi:hypothetical protein
MDKVYKLTGWYEGDHGAILVNEQGFCLSAIVARMQMMDNDFGHTDMELELELPTGVVKDINPLVGRMVQP